MIRPLHVRHLVTLLINSNRLVTLVSFITTTSFSTCESETLLTHTVNCEANQMNVCDRATAITVEILRRFFGWSSYSIDVACNYKKRCIYGSA